MTKLVILVAVLAILAGCRSTDQAEIEPTRLPEPTEATVEVPRPTVTPIPYLLPPTVEAPHGAPSPVAATPTLEPVQSVEASDNGEQTEPDSQPDASGGEGEELVEPATPTPTVVIEPTATPRPTATPQWRPALTEATILGYEGFELSGPVIRSGVMSMSAVIDSHSITPTEVQVWESLRQDDYGGRCPTTKPIALIAGSPVGGYSDIQWEFCQYNGDHPVIHVDAVPWLTASSWEYSKRPRRRTTEPYIADWSMSVSLNDDRVEDLRFSRAEGYTVVIFAKDLLLAKIWVDY